MVRTALCRASGPGLFIRAFNAISTYKPRYKFSSWIFKIANNHTIDYLRKRKLDTVSIDGSPTPEVRKKRTTRLVGIT